MLQRTEREPMSARPAALRFHGPFTFVDHGRRRAGSEFARSEWIYLWTMRDDPAPIYGGMWRDRSPDPITNTVKAWLELHERIHANLETIEVFFAPPDCSNEMREHSEGCLARQLRQRHPESARFYPADNRTIPRKMQGMRIAVTAEAPIEALDPEIEV